MPQTLSNLQLELLKSFSRNVSDEDVLAIKRLITTHFAQKATEGADQVWDAEGWNQQFSLYRHPPWTRSGIFCNVAPGARWKKMYAPRWPESPSSLPCATSVKLPVCGFVAGGFRIVSYALPGAGALRILPE